MTNPYVLLALFIALAAAIAGAGYEGHKFGVDQQKAADQGQFDAFNKQVDANKAQAAALLAKANADILAAITERDQAKHQLEVTYAQAQQATDTLRTQFASQRLRFTIPTPAAGNGGGGTDGTAPDANRPAGPTVVQLPDQISSDLWQLAYDADKLKDAYAACYADDQVK